MDISYAQFKETNEYYPNWIYSWRFDFHYLIIQKYRLDSDSASGAMNVVSH